MSLANDSSHGLGDNEEARIAGKVQLWHDLALDPGPRAWPCYKTLTSDEKSYAIRLYPYLFDLSGEDDNGGPIFAIPKRRAGWLQIAASLEALGINGVAACIRANAPTT